MASTEQNDKTVAEIRRMLPDDETIYELANLFKVFGDPTRAKILGCLQIRSMYVCEIAEALEMIHTYSLVHDDLPAMDNDEYRRGKKTTHAVYGEAMGILAGDALLNYAFETAAKAFDMEPDNRNIGKAMQILATKAGIYGMVGGQVVDVQSEDSGDITKEKLDFIYRLKTGALIESSMLIGAVLAGATKNEQNTIGKAATEVGLAFQIQDDILDVTSTLEVLGKPIGSDEKNHKATYVSFEGLEKAKEDVALYTNSAVARMDSLVVKNEFLNELLLYLISREK